MRLQSGQLCLVWPAMNLLLPVIRPMVAVDLDAVLVIEEASFATPWRREHFTHEISARFSFPFVALIDDVVVGYVCVESLFEEAQILDIAVAPDQRGRGIAAALMQAGFAVACEQGAQIMVLEVRASNSAAIGLYQRLGFERSGIRAGYYGGREDAVLMEKKL